MLSQTMAKAWAPEISVNCVAPGMIVQGEVDEAYEHFARKTPMQRNGTARRRRRGGCFLRHRAALHHRAAAGGRWRPWPVASVRELPSQSACCHQLFSSRSS